MPAEDKFEGFADGLNSAFVGGFDVVPSDADELPKVARGFMITTPGDVAVVFKNGDELTLPGLVPGQQYIGRIKQVRASGTTATGIKALV